MNTAFCNRCHMTSCKQTLIIQQNGLTLWELLITLLLISTGVTGTAGLQLYLVQQGRLAYQSTQSTLITLALSEQLRTAATTNVNSWKPTTTANSPDVMTCTDSTPDDGTQATDAACDEQGVIQVVKLWWQNHLSPADTQPTLRLSFRLSE